MSGSFEKDNEAAEPVTITDKRRIDPATGQVRDAASGSTPGGSEPEAAPPAGGADAPDAGRENEKAAELLADLQRVQADFANYRKRVLREQQAAVERAKAAVVAELLPILDDLDRARAHGDLAAGPFKAFADKLVSTLESLGLSSFGSEGEAFDPMLHEAVQHEGSGENPVIGTVMRRGYKFGELVVRHALVGVVDAEPEAGADPGPTDGRAAESAETDQ
ncbi:nucleotide exchange factor GrpE [uncultured Mycolicibacterium sp.]|uniref:nucleotide exchange factor GrpE n=1 Tax=uncultured Mycolicibacterium sp. TaxID=2320817 RepID=UPI00260FD300|nr:nucleotide exchange factor GrpE [uncultured Mycolicibacterium sp.]